VNPETIVSGIIGWIVIGWFVYAFLLRPAVRGAVRARRDAAELRHRRQVELLYAAAGRPPANVRVIPDQGIPQPAAAIPAPPGARSARGIPGPCRHEQIIPVINGGGDVLRWICANYPRCEADFPAGTAVYEEGDIR